MGERYGSSVWSSLSKSELVAILVDSHNLRGAPSATVDNEILLQLEALIACTVIGCIRKDCNYTEI